MSIVRGGTAWPVATTFFQSVLLSPSTTVFNSRHFSSNLPAIASARAPMSASLKWGDEHSAPSRTLEILPPPQPRIQRVVEPLADQVDGQHGEQDRDARDGAEPPGRARRPPESPSSSHWDR